MSETAILAQYRSACTFKFIVIFEHLSANKARPVEYIGCHNDSPFGRIVSPPAHHGICQASAYCVCSSWSATTDKIFLFTFEWCGRAQSIPIRSDIFIWKSNRFGLFVLVCLSIAALEIARGSLCPDCVPHIRSALWNKWAIDYFLWPFVVGIVLIAVKLKNTNCTLRRHVEQTIIIYSKSRVNASAFRCKILRVAASEWVHRRVNVRARFFLRRLFVSFGIFCCAHFIFLGLVVCQSHAAAHGHKY